MKMPRAVLTVISVLVMLGLWEGLGRFVNPIFASTPLAIADAFVDMARSGALWKALLDRKTSCRERVSSPV